MSTDIQRGDRLVGFEDGMTTFIHVTQVGQMTPTRKSGYRLEIYTYKGKRVVCLAEEAMVSYLKSIKAKRRRWSFENVMSTAPAGVMSFNFT